MMNCYECNLPIEDEDEVWVDPGDGRATTGDSGRPYHVGCAPNEWPEDED